MKENKDSKTSKSIRFIIDNLKKFKEYLFKDDYKALKISSIVVVIAFVFVMVCVSYKKGWSETMNHKLDSFFGILNEKIFKKIKNFFIKIFSKKEEDANANNGPQVPDKEKGDVVSKEGVYTYSVVYKEDKMKEGVAYNSKEVVLYKHNKPRFKEPKEHTAEDDYKNPLKFIEVLKVENNYKNPLKFIEDKININHLKLKKDTVEDKLKKTIVNFKEFKEPIVTVKDEHKNDLKKIKLKMKTKTEESIKDTEEFIQQDLN